MHEIDQKNLKKFLDKENKDIKILDVGCGLGANIQLMESWGFKNIFGTDISQEMLKECEEKGLNVSLSGDLSDSKFDLLLFSHVIEHISYPEIINFLEFYFSKLEDGGRVIIITPCQYTGFYNDIDHIKPYYPNALINCFSKKKMSRQYGSDFNLVLRDIHFRKEVIANFDVRSGYINDFQNKIIRNLRRKFFNILNVMTFGSLSKTTGYAALFHISYDK